MNLRGQKVAIIGIGKTGRATARFLAGRGARITITDEKPAAAWGEAKVELAALPAEMTFAPYGPEVLAGADLVIPSPGVYPANPILAEALRREIPVLSEIDLAWRFLKTPLIAALLNVTFDHIDYHGSFAAYRQIKERIFARQRADDLAILNADEAPTASLRGRLTARTEIFSSAVT